MADKKEPYTPKIGLGTAKIRDQETLTKFLNIANDSSYDFIDCAWRYGNEAIIGLALKSLKREDPKFNLNLRFQSKVWPTQFFGGITKSLKFTLQKIGAISAADAYMLHRPSTDMTLNLSAWKQLIECRRNRLTKKIGLGHFDKDVMEMLFRTTGIRPEFLQIELSVNNMRYDRIYYCREHNIDIQAYEPLGDYEENKNNPIIVNIAHKHETTVKNILLAFLINQEITPVVIPDTEEEITEFLKAKDIKLSEEEMEALRSINTFKNRHFETFELDSKDKEGNN